MTDGAQRWSDALLAAQLLARAPHRLKGAIVRSGPGPVRDAWLDALAEFSGPDCRFRRVPAAISDDRLLGGLDLSATLAAGRPLAERGLLAQADGGVLVVPMAERLPAMAAALLCAAIDAGEVMDGLGALHPSRFLTILLDEGVTDERVCDALAERLAFRLDLDGMRLSDLAIGQALEWAEPGEMVEDPVPGLCAAADLLGVASMRADSMALAVAVAHAGLRGAYGTAEGDLMAAVRLVLAPRATRLPAAQPDGEPTPPPPESQDAEQPPAGQPDDPEADADADADADLGADALADLLVETARAAIPDGLLAMLAAGNRRPSRAIAGDGGRGEGTLGRAPTSGRRAGVRAGRPRAGSRLDIVETLKAAAPWQQLRRQEPAGGAGGAATAIHVRTSDFRVRKLVRRMGSTILFVVDASGSAAMARLGEAKGAAELLLADAYVRRDDVAMIAFRGSAAELLLPPTRSLPRAKRALADLAGGGGTPIAAALGEARRQALGVRARGKTPLLVILTDGRANVAADGTASAGRAQDDALAAARAIRADGIRALMIDTAARPRPEGRALAEAMGARHVPLPRVEAGVLRDVVRAAA